MEFWHEYLSMVADPAHWTFEFTVGTVKDAIIFGVGTFVGRRWLKRHDRTHHNND